MIGVVRIDSLGIWRVGRQLGETFDASLINSWHAELR